MNGDMVMLNGVQESEDILVFDMSNLWLVPFVDFLEVDLAI